MNLKSLQHRVKQLIGRRGGTESLKEDAEELKDIATGPGSIGDKAKRAGEAVKEPGAKEPDEPATDAPTPPASASDAPGSPEPGAPRDA
jgi:hypothetical protein